VPIVFDAHESYPDMVEASLGATTAGVLRRIERFLVPRVSAVVTVGERLAQHYRALHAGRVVVAGNWKDPVDFALEGGARSLVRSDLGIPDEALLVSDIGWLGEERQLVPFLQAVHRSPGVWALVGGRGPLSDHCREAAAACPRIRYLGWVDGDRVPELTAASDAVFYGFDPGNGNARYSAPNKLFEAIAAGIPVLTGPFGEIEQIAREEGIGVVLPDYGVEEIVRGFREIEGNRVPARRFESARRRYSRSAADAVVRDLLREVLATDGKQPASLSTVPSCR
jgi:glycosyltransferase involved in cell wall biosynthesis